MQKYRGTPNAEPVSEYDIKVGRPDATIMNLWMLGSKNRLVARYTITGTMPIIVDEKTLIATFMEKPETAESEPMNMCKPGKS
jgi:hypothetical protein